jgi:hypothetical protein
MTRPFFSYGSARATFGEDSITGRRGADQFTRNLDGVEDMEADSRSREEQFITDVEVGLPRGVKGWSMTQAALASAVKQAKRGGDWARQIRAARNFVNKVPASSRSIAMGVIFDVENLIQRRILTIPIEEREEATEAFEGEVGAQAARDGGPMRRETEQRDREDTARAVKEGDWSYGVSSVPGGRSLVTGYASAKDAVVANKMKFAAAGAALLLLALARTRGQ